MRAAFLVSAVLEINACPLTNASVESIGQEQILQI